MKKTMTDGDLLIKYMVEMYGVQGDETNYWNGQYYYWNEIKDFKGLLDK